MTYVLKMPSRPIEGMCTLIIYPKVSFTVIIKRKKKPDEPLYDKRRWSLLIITYQMFHDLIILC